MDVERSLIPELLSDYFYEIDLVWDHANTGKLGSRGLPGIEVNTMLHFINGNKDKWSAEHLMAGAVSSSLMTKFLEMALSHHLDVLSYKSQSFIKLHNRSGTYEAAEILIRPSIQLHSESDLDKAIDLMDKAEKDCPMKNVLKLITAIHTQFTFK